ncbi:MAG: hypothetical protein R2873_13355 [Caldilineaceae bacterium]
MPLTVEIAILLGLVVAMGQAHELTVLEPGFIAAVEFGDEALREPFFDVGVFLTAAQIQDLTGGVLLVEKLKDVAHRVVDQLEAPIGDHARGHGVFAALAVEDVAALLAHHRHAVHAVGNGQARQIEQRGHDVLPADEAVIDTMVADAIVPCRAHQDHGDVGGVVVEKALGPQPVIAQHIPVIRGEEDDRVVEQLFLTQRADDETQLVIDVVHSA